MAVCPNCGRKLHLTDWRPECPECKVNLNYFKSNERLLEDSEKAEIEHAHFQPHIDRAKAAFVGSKLTIVRIVLSVLPIGALFLPLAVFKGAENKSVNAIDIYNLVSKIDFGIMFDEIGKGDMFALCVLPTLLSVVLILVNLIAILASFGKHGKMRTFILNGLFLAFSVFAAVAFSMSTGASVLLENQYTGVALGIGTYIYLALILALLIWNIVLYKRGVEVKYTPCLIGGLPSEEYFGYVEAGCSRDEIYRKMLVALAKLEEESEKEIEEEGEVNG